MSVTNGTVQIVCNAVLSRHGGDLYVGIMTVINSVREIITMPVTGLTSGAQPVIGYNYGAGCYGRVRSAIKFMSIGCIVFSLAVWAVLFFEPRSSSSVYTGERADRGGHSGDEDLFLRDFYDGAPICRAVYLCGVETVPKQAVFFSLFRKVIIVVPLTLFLPMAGGLGTNGVFLAEPVSNVLGGTASL